MTEKGRRLRKLSRSSYGSEELLSLAFHFMAAHEFNFRGLCWGKRQNTNQFHFSLIMIQFHKVANSENGFLREPRSKCIEAEVSLNVCCVLETE